MRNLKLTRAESVLLFLAYAPLIVILFTACGKSGGSPSAQAGTAAPEVTLAHIKGTGYECLIGPTMAGQGVPAESETLWCWGTNPYFSPTAISALTDSVISGSVTPYEYGFDYCDEAGCTCNGTNCNPGYGPGENDTETCQIVSATELSCPNIPSISGMQFPQADFGGE